MATIGSLNIVLSTSTALFTKGLGTAERGLRAFTGKVGGLKPMLEAIGLGLGAAGIGLAVKKIVQTGAEFEHQMRAVKAVSGASAAELELLDKKARDLGQGFFGAKEAAEGMEILAQAGFDTGTILKTIGPTLDLAAAGSVELAQAADVASSVMRGMGISADRLGQVVDVLARASSASNADVSGLGEALKTAGPVAHAAGKSIEETVAAIETFSNAGIKGEEAGTAMRQIFISMASQTPEAQKALKKLGVAMTDAAGNVRPLADVIDDFNAKLAGLGSGNKLDILSTIFDARGAGHFAALLGQGGDALRNFEKDLQNASGSAAQQAATRMDSLSGSWTKFKHSIESLSITITKDAGGWLRSIVDFGTRAVGFVNTVWPAISQTIGATLGAIWQMISEGWQAVGDVTASLLGVTSENVSLSMRDIEELVVVGLASVEFAFIHWKDLAAIAGLSVAAGVVTLGNQISYVFTEVIPKTLDWLAQNWRDIFFTLTDFTLTVMINLGQNIRNVMSEIWEFITSGGSHAIDFEHMWTPLTQGFVNTIRKMPEIADREMGALEAQLYQSLEEKQSALSEEFGGFVSSRLDEFRKREAAAGQAPEGPAPMSPAAEPPPSPALAPAGVGEAKQNKALEMGTAEAFHASFGKQGSDGRTLKDILSHTIAQQRDVQRMRQIQERNQVQTASF